MNPESFSELLDLLWGASLETLYMVALSGFVTLMAGLPAGLALYLIDGDGPLPRPRLHRVLSTIVNIGRSLPFVVLLIAIIPLTRLIAGTSLGSTAAIVPLSLGSIPFFARVVEAALREVDKGRIEAVQAMGGTLRHLVFMVLLPEALPALLSGVTLTLVMLVGYSALAGVVGGGGLGDLAIRYGYLRFNTEVMVATVVVLIVLVQAIQLAGDWAVRRLAHRR